MVRYGFQVSTKSGAARYLPLKLLFPRHSSLIFLSQKMAATFSVGPDLLSAGSAFPRPPVRLLDAAPIGKSIIKEPRRGAILHSRRTLTRTATPIQAGSRADDSAPFEMTLENALKLLGVSEGASFDDILRAKKSILATCKDDQEAISQVSLSCSFHSALSSISENFREFERKLDSVCLL